MEEWRCLRCNHEQDIWCGCVVERPGSSLVDAHPAAGPRPSDFFPRDGRAPRARWPTPWACADCGVLFVHRTTLRTTPEPVSCLISFVVSVVAFGALLALALDLRLVPLSVRLHSTGVGIAIGASFLLYFGVGIFRIWRSERLHHRAHNQTPRPLRCPDCGGRRIKQPSRAVDRRTANGPRRSSSGGPDSAALLADPRRRFLRCPACNQRAFIPVAYPMVYWGSDMVGADDATATAPSASRD